MGTANVPTHCHPQPSASFCWPPSPVGPQAWPARPGEVLGGGQVTSWWIVQRKRVLLRVTHSLSSSNLAFCILVWYFGLISCASEAWVEFPRAKGYLLEMGGDSGGSELNVEVRRESWHGLHIRTDNGRRMLSAISDSCCVCRSLDKGVTAKPERLTSYAGIRTGNRVRLGFVPTFSLAWEPDLKAWMIQSC